MPVAVCRMTAWDGRTIIDPVGHGPLGGSRHGGFGVADLHAVRPGMVRDASRAFANRRSEVDMLRGAA